jgi:hypothetical protein
MTRKESVHVKYRCIFFKYFHSVVSQICELRDLLPCFLFHVLICHMHTVDSRPGCRHSLFLQWSGNIAVGLGELLQVITILSVITSGYCQLLVLEAFAPDHHKGLAAVILHLRGKGTTDHSALPTCRDP